VLDHVKELFLKRYKRIWTEVNRYQIRNDYEEMELDDGRAIQSTILSSRHFHIDIAIK
jgi:hypothetical protein